MNSMYGVLVKKQDSVAFMGDNIISDCLFTDVEENTIVTEGTMYGLHLYRNTSNNSNNDLKATIEQFVELDNSWNMVSE